MAVALENEDAPTTDRTSIRNQRIEVITGRERRRRWTADQKREIAAESLQPGVSPVMVARNTASAAACSIHGGNGCCAALRRGGRHKAAFRARRCPGWVPTPGGNHT